jgi:hypothetical protein
MEGNVETELQLRVETDQNIDRIDLGALAQAMIF